VILPFPRPSPRSLRVVLPFFCPGFLVPFLWALYLPRPHYFLLLALRRGPSLLRLLHFFPRRLLRPPHEVPLQPLLFPAAKVLPRQPLPPLQAPSLTLCLTTTFR
jgi:hypothetical protein